jgi:hypothetical protein
MQEKLLSPIFRTDPGLQRFFGPQRNSLKKRTFELAAQKDKIF